MKLPKVIAITAVVAIVVGVVVGLSVWAANRSTDDSDNAESSDSTVPLTSTEPTIGAVSFPESFKIGAASASYQIEGGWNEDGKSPNVWDTITHKRPEYIVDYSNGDVAADSYHLYQKDIDALDNIGV